MADCGGGISTQRHRKVVAYRVLHGGVIAADMVGVVEKVYFFVKKLDLDHVTRPNPGPKMG
jgi:hypothetical protein